MTEQEDPTLIELAREEVKNLEPAEPDPRGLPDDVPTGDPDSQ